MREQSFLFRFVIIWLFLGISMSFFLEKRWSINEMGLTLKEFVSLFESMQLQDFSLVDSSYTFFRAV